MSRGLKVLSFFAAICLLGCGKSNDSDSNTRSYRIKLNGCDSGQHIFHGKSPEEATHQMCDALQNQELNNNCPPQAREKFFAANCPGRSFVLSGTPTASAMPSRFEKPVASAPKAESPKLDLEAVKNHIAQAKTLPELVKYLRGRFFQGSNYFDDAAVAELTPTLEAKLPLILSSNDSQYQEAFLNFSEATFFQFTKFNSELYNGFLSLPVESLRVEAAGNLIDIEPGHELAKKIVRQGAKSKDAPVRANAYYFLGKTVDYDAIDRTLVINGMGDSDPDVRNAATSILDDLNLNSSDLILIKPFLKNTNDSVKNEAAYLIGKLDSDGASIALIERMNGASTDVRNTITTALDDKTLSAKTIDPLVIVLKNGADWARTEAAYLLGKMDDTRAVNALISKLDDRDSSVRNTITSALDDKNLGDENVGPLSSVLNSGSPNARSEAAYLLGRVGSPPAKASLSKRKASEKNQDVLNAIDSALDN